MRNETNLHRGHHMARKRGNRKRGAYAERVVGVLPNTGAFDLDDATRTALGRYGEEWLRDPGPGFEFILDNPAVANWRLKAHPTSKTFRLTDYAYYTTAERVAFADEVNEALRDLEG